MGMSHFGEAILVIPACDPGRIVRFLTSTAVEFGQGNGKSKVLLPIDGH